MSWKLGTYCEEFSNTPLPPMTKEEIASAIKELRSGGYPKPEDCPEMHCSEHRPACHLGICKIAVCLCGDF